jgi:hypothetical protein
LIFFEKTPKRGKAVQEFESGAEEKAPQESGGEGGGSDNRLKKIKISQKQPAGIKLAFGLHFTLSA